MKLLCPKCNHTLSQSEINVEKAIAHCSICNELFKIADFIKSSEEIRRTKKPINSDVELIKAYDGTTIEIPSEGWVGHIIFGLIFSIVWNGIVLTILLSKKGAMDSVFLIPFVLIGTYLMLYNVFMATSKTIIHYNKEYIMVTWTLLKLSYSKKQESSALEKITEHVVYTKNYQPVYGIGLFFNNGKKIKFGSGLHEDERKWLIGELYELKANYKK